MSYWCSHLPLSLCKRKVELEYLKGCYEASLKNGQCPLAVIKKKKKEKKRDRESLKFSMQTHPTHTTTRLSLQPGIYILIFWLRHQKTKLTISIEILGPVLHFWRNRSLFHLSDMVRSGLVTLNPVRKILLSRI